MAQSLSKLYVHIVFHIRKSSNTPIREEDSSNLYSYMGAIIKDLESYPILINGTNDHVHILCVQSKNIAISKLIEDIKRHSSRWIKTLNNSYKDFAWQNGYGAFSVSPSLYDKTIKYIERQKEHHKRYTFKEEYALFLKEYNIDYDEKYVWED